MAISTCLQTFAPIVFQNRIIGSLEFNRNLSAYTNGFGDVADEFWLGLKYIQEITNLPSDLRWEAVTTSGVSGNEVYGEFKLLGDTYTFSASKPPMKAERNRITNDDLFNSLNLVPFRIDYDHLHMCVNDTNVDDLKAGWWYPVSKCEHKFFSLNGNGRLPGHDEIRLRSTRMMVRREQ
ncbi:angiopoietin-related protein 4-like [Ruditapes philippinarum]|uniref:angiopoietin-related protein 4-like n=1 Tax=Ruditapes philippinarum TaxID=129788 RepID=UPI00295AFDD9|nr:angiopoietin-related protein 4-like [Ruditapes philippinarum]